MIAKEVVEVSQNCIVFQLSDFSLVLNSTSRDCGPPRDSATSRNASLTSFVQIKVLLLVYVLWKNRPLNFEHTNG